MRVVKVKVCRIRVGHVQEGELLESWYEDVLKHMTDEQAAKYLRKKYDFTVVMLGKENIVEMLDVEKAYFVMKDEAKHE